MAHPTPRQLKTFLKPYDSSTQKLALSLRQIVLDEMGPCYEHIYDAYSAVAIGYGVGPRMPDFIFHIAVYSNHVNLGFNWGATLPDPDRLLEGSGKQIRHISIRTEADLAKPVLRQYIKKAMAAFADDARKLGEQTPQRPTKVISTVKAIYKKKRRPN